MINKYIEEHNAALAKLTDTSTVEKAAASIADCFLSGNKLYIIGSGISHVMARYAEAMFVGSNARPPLPALALLPEYYLSSEGYNDIFEKQLTAQLSPTDTLFAISTGHPCEAVIKALRCAGQTDATVIGFSGKDNGILQGLCDILISVDNNSPQITAEIHIVLLHALCRRIDNIMFSLS